MTQRQQQVLALMLQRHTHQEIARALGLTTHTVQNHMVEIWDRLCQRRNRAFAARLLEDVYRIFTAETESGPAQPPED